MWLSHPHWNVPFVFAQWGNRMLDRFVARSLGFWNHIPFLDRSLGLVLGLSPFFSFVSSSAELISASASLSIGCKGWEIWGILAKYLSTYLKQCNRLKTKLIWWVLLTQGSDRKPRVLWMTMNPRHLFQHSSVLLTYCSVYNGGLMKPLTPMWGYSELIWRVRELIISKKAL